MDIVLKEVNTVLQENQEAVMCIVTQTKGSSPRKAGAKMLVKPGGKITGTIGGGKVEFEVIQKACEIMGTENPLVLSFSLDPSNGLECGGKMEVYLEPLGGKGKLYIFGAGHVGNAIARLAVMMGFVVIMCDERPGMTDNCCIENVKCLNAPYNEILSSIKFTPADFAVVTTHAHTFDIEVTAYLAPLNLAWIGMIGSRSKVSTARRRFMEEFNLTEDQINSIEMPVGVPIAAETPEEIALSIVARLVDVKNRALGYKPKSGPIAQ